MIIAKNEWFINDSFTLRLCVRSITLRTVLKFVVMKVFNVIDPINLISPEQRAVFQSVERFEEIPCAFSDSTNQLWYAIENEHKVGVLKLCFKAGVDDSVFWIGMKGVFGLDYPSQMGKYSKVYALIASLSSVAVPKLVACESASEEYAGFIYSSMLSAQTAHDEVNEVWVQQLSTHLGGLHQFQQKQFGALFEPEYSAEQWWPNIQNSIQALAELKGMDVNVQSLVDGLSIPQNFVPIMPDLRWDQFMGDSTKLTGLVDLDAFVFGAVELEFVILEYLLDEQQAEVFKKAYQQFGGVPALNACREVYRVLLYFMNILGEESFDAWMQAPTRF